MDHSDFTLDPNVTYLNHGSFGPSPKSVQEVRKQWIDRIERQPMQFMVRDLEQALDAALQPLAELIGTQPKNLTFVDNATFGMNIVAQTLPLEPGDEVLLSDHEYGAVIRIWRQRCRETGAQLVVQKLPSRFGSHEELVDKLFSGVTPKTKVIVISHVTSATSAILPVAEICRRARQQKIPVCIDGPHAVGMVPLNLDQMSCDFYCASCHKWLSAPFGTGFLYVAPKWQHRLEPAVVSWGGSVSGRESTWQDEFNWVGTRDLSGFLAVPEAIRCLETHGWNRFRQMTFDLSRLAAERITKLTGMVPLMENAELWNGSMVTLPIPGPYTDQKQHGRKDPLQVALFEEDRIEIPVFSWKQQRYLRVSSHLYNSEADIDRLITALKKHLF